MTDVLDDLVMTLTGQALELTTDGPTVVDTASLLERLRNQLRQLPVAFEDFQRLDRGLATDAASNRDGERLRAAMKQLRTHDLLVPPSKSGPLRLDALDEEAQLAYRLLARLDHAVPAPWTLIGGLMVLSLCIEFRGPHIRPTGDADVAVGVFTHRHALRAFTAVLAQEGFKDVTPASADSESTSYRWRRDGLLIDVAVPPEVNEQRTSPTTINNRVGLELPATQQAIRRTEAVDVEVAGERVGRLRRPNLLGAIVIKSTAAIVDSRDPERHHEDIVSLADIIAFEGLQSTYRDQVSRKDARRLRHAVLAIPIRQWRRARDPEAARAAVEYLYS